jgi:hypothetical protein
VYVGLASDDPFDANMKSVAQMPIVPFAPSRLGNRSRPVCCFVMSASPR